VLDEFREASYARLTDLIPPRPRPKPAAPASTNNQGRGVTAATHEQGRGEKQILK
jgi:hypothetical protein